MEGDITRRTDGHMMNADRGIELTRGYDGRMERGDLKNVLVILCLFTVAFLIRAIDVSNICIYGGDELLYWTDTEKILADNFAPRADVFDYMTPFLPYVGAAVTLLFEGDLNTLRMISVVFGSLSVPVMYLLGKTMYDRKTGLLSAMLLCLSSYHCLFSRIYMLEAFTLFFIISFLYFFQLSERALQMNERRKSEIYAIVAGVMMGLAFDAKYLSSFLILSVPAYLLWTRRFRMGALLEKRILMLFLLAFLTVLPLLICLFYTGVGFHGFLYYSVERYERGESLTGERPITFTLDELILRGGGEILNVYTWGAGSDIMGSFLTGIFKISAIFLLMSSFLLYLFYLVIREVRGCFLVIHLAMLIAILLNIGNSRHYLIYTFPFVFVMFSHFVVRFSSDLIMRTRGYRGVLGISAVVFMGIVMLFYAFTTATAHKWDKGGYNPWLEDAVRYVETDIMRNGYDRDDIMIGTVMVTNKMVDYQLYLDGFNISTCNLLKRAPKYSGEYAIIDIEKVEILKPAYIIVSEPFYEAYFKETVKIDIFEDYDIVFHSENYPHGSFVLKRKHVEPEKKLESEDRGMISEEVFRISMPGFMKVGERYTALLEIRNTGDSRANFPIFVDHNRYIIFVEPDWCNVTLDKGSSAVIKFKIVPMCRYDGKLPVTVNLYFRSDENPMSVKKVDAVTVYIYRIK
ncbi:MAG: glycosyltransferase family 39 protein [Canidatus Methanoxibalbensis ujae]|nr:glycosyltransferase family 39 protein [Candidatus Methanoxibalbensis ujae]